MARGFISEDQMGKKYHSWKNAASYAILLNFTLSLVAILLSVIALLSD